MHRAPSSCRFAAALLLGAVLIGPIHGQDRPEVFPVEPVDAAVVGPRPVFRLGYTGVDDAKLRQTGFRIVLESSRMGGDSYVFDQRRRSNGWAAGEPGRMLYRPRRPLPDGPYEWRVSLWDGVSWSDGAARFRLRIDSVPPAAVTGLLVRYDHERRLVELEWTPVTSDAEGGAEFVAGYHVYRYPRADVAPQARPYQVTWTEQTRVRLPLEDSTEQRLWFYRVTAEDLAGNEAGRPD